MNLPTRLLNRNFLLLWQGGAVSMLGSEIYLVAIMLWVKEATGSPSLAGTMMMVGGLARFLSPLGGALADRYSRVRILVMMDLASGVAILALAGVFFTVPAWTGFLLVSLFAINLFREGCGSLFRPAVTALVPDLVPAARLNSANSVMQSTHFVALFSGQGVGGVLFRILGAPVLFLIDGVSYLLSALSECFIKAPAPTSAPAVPAARADTAGAPWRGVLAAVGRDARDGFRYALTKPGLRIYILLSPAGNFVLASFFVLLPFYVDDTLHARVDWYGFLLAAFGAGNLAGTVAAGFSNLRGRARVALLLPLMAVIPLGLTVLGVTGSRSVALGGLFCSGLATGFYSIYVMSILQRTTPAEMRGRIFGLLAFFRYGMTPLGMGFFGILSGVLDRETQGIFIVSGLVLVVMVTLAGLRREFRAFLGG